MGVAGSLRGLAFHTHAASMNEAVIGRKIMALFPPRESVQGVTFKCPWAPWEAGTEVEAESWIEDFFVKDYVPKQDKSKLHSCLDLKITPLHWLVYEYPKLPPDRRPLLVMMHPGEALWIPDSWQHLTLNLDDSLYIYKPACQNQGAASIVTVQQERAVVRHFCQQFSRFCHGYCHSFCASCDDEQGHDCGL